MTPEQERELLSEALNSSRPKLRNFINPMKSDMTTGSWDLVAFSFESGFEALWDKARSQTSAGLLVRPLLMLWRHSVELSLKAALKQISPASSTDIEKAGHTLPTLVQMITDRLKELGDTSEDEIDIEVMELVQFVTSIDPFATRFRYPTDKKGNIYDGLDVDLVQLYQAHWIVTTWAGGIAVEYEFRT